MDGEYNLAKSKTKVGSLVPILQDAHGNIIDGFHRLKIDPEWPTLKLENIRDNLQLTIARLVANVARREMTQEEKTLLLTEIAEATGWSPADIANATGMSYQWVCKYLPDHYKAEYVKTPTQSLQRREYVEKETQVKEFKPKETWEHRKAVMTPQHSKMEHALRQKLAEKGFNPIVDYEICIQATTPDFYFVDKRLAIYIDGPVHNGHEDRDDLIREQLTKRHGIRVVSINYEVFTQQETERVLSQILEVIES